MTAIHTPGCPALDDPRDGCACPLRQMMAPLLDHLIAAQGGHYPECPVDNPYTGLTLCICDRLRACEARVREDLYADAEVEEYNTKHFDAGIARGRAAALDAAMEAVAAVQVHPPRWWIDRNDTLAAIAALKEKP